MKPMRFGLQARFLAAMALMLVVVIALLGTLLQTMMEKVGTDLSKLPPRVFEHAGWVGWRLAQVRRLFLCLCLRRNRRGK